MRVLIALYFLTASPMFAQSPVPWRILGDTTGAPRGCSAAKGAETISLFLAAMRKADSARLVRYVAPHFAFTMGPFTRSEAFFSGKSIPALLQYARNRSGAHERMTIQAVRFNGWRGRDLQFGPIWFLRYADDLGRPALPGIGKGTYRCGEGIVVFNLARRPAGDRGPDRYRGIPR